MEKARERPEPAREGAKDDEAPPSTVESATRVHGAPTRCPWCHDACAVEDTSAIVCQRCLSRHHAPCWRDGGRCASCQGTKALGPVAAPREVAPAELALVRANRVREAVERIARRVGCTEGEAAMALLEASARELAGRDGKPLGPFATTVIALAVIIAIMVVLIVSVHAIFR